MSINPAVTAALVAGLVSLAGAVVSYRSNSEATLRQVQQAQFNGVIARRIEIYPALWRIIIHYEVNWTFERKPKTTEWAREFVSALNDFNLDGGLFFSQEVYEKFGSLRHTLDIAIEDAQDGRVRSDHTESLHSIIYGNPGPGLSTFLKDDLGSYTPAVLQARARRIG